MDSKDLLKQKELTVTGIQQNEQTDNLQTGLKTGLQGENTEKVVTQQAGFSFDEKMHDLFKTPEESVKLQTNSDVMMESHQPIYERRLKKKHLVKKDEYEMVPLTTGKKEIVQKKKEFSAKVEENANALKSRQIKFQDEVDINVAKKTTFSVVKSLSAFTDGMQTEQEFNELIKSYTGGGNTVKEKADASRFTVLSTLTEKIMSIKPSDFDVSTMERIAETSEKLELMASQVDAYQELLKANEDYKSKLEEQKDEAGKTYLWRVEERLHELGKISRYYRIQKLIMEDSVYQNSRNNEISMEVSEKDDFQTKRLKKLLRVSYYMGKNLSGAELPDLETKGILSQNTDHYAKKTFDKNDDALRKAEKNAANSLKRQREIADNFPTRQEQERHWNEQQKIIAKKLDAARKQQLAEDEALETEVRKLEFERLFVPSDNLKMKLTSPERNDEPKLAYLGTVSYETEMGAEAVKRMGKYGLIEKVREYRNNLPQKTLAAAEFPEAKGFAGETKFSDAFDRMLNGFAIFAYKQNEDEMLQVVKNMTVISTQKYADYKNDPEAMKYFESCFVDAAVKYQAFEYAAIKRVANGIGDKPYILHPKDLILQDNPELRATLSTCVTITNHCTKKNGPLVKAFMGKFNTSGKYPVDIAEMEVLGLSYSQVQMKMNYWGRALADDVQLDQGKYFPQGTDKKVMEWYNEKHSKDTNFKKITRVTQIEICEWLDENYHEEIATGKFFDKKDAQGNYVFENAFALSTQTLYSADLTPVQALLKYDGIDHPSEDELNAYEKKLKEKDYIVVGEEKDPYLIDQYKKNYRDFTTTKDGKFAAEGMEYYVENIMSEKDKKKFTVD